MLFTRHAQIWKILSITGFERRKVTETQPRRILFVDDEPPVLNLLQTLIRHAQPDWESAFTDRGAKALQMMEQAPFDAVVTDMRMPEMNGAELLEQVRDRYPRTARLVLSGYADQPLSARALGAAHQYLTKPFTLAGLQGTLNRLFEVRRYLADARVQEALGGLHALPAGPTLHGRFEQDIASPSATGDILSSSVAQDVALTAKFLQIVHSAFFGPPRGVTLAKDCVRGLGVGLIRSLTLGNQLSVPPMGQELGGVSLDAVSRHGVATGLRATRIMALERAAPDAVKLAFTGGVLHGVGRLAMASLFPEAYARAMQRARSGEVTLLQAEEQGCGASHAQAGAYLLGLWGLPEPLVSLVANVSQPGKARASSASVTALAAVHVASRLEIASSDVPSAATEPLDEAYLHSLMVDSARLTSWKEATREFA